MVSPFTPIIKLDFAVDQYDSKEQLTGNFNKRLPYQIKHFFPTI
jgi:hypothetical protein